MRLATALARRAGTSSHRDALLASVLFTALTLTCGCDTNPYDRASLENRPDAGDRLARELNLIGADHPRFMKIAAGMQYLDQSQADAFLKSAELTTLLEGPGERGARGDYRKHLASLLNNATAAQAGEVLAVAFHEFNEFSRPTDAGRATLRDIIPSLNRDVIREALSRLERENVQIPTLLSEVGDALVEATISRGDPALEDWKPLLGQLLAALSLPHLARDSEAFLPVERLLESLADEQIPAAVDLIVDEVSQSKTDSPVALVLSALGIDELVADNNFDHGALRERIRSTASDSEDPSWTRRLIALTSLHSAATGKLGVTPPDARRILQSLPARVGMDKEANRLHASLLRALPEDEVVQLLPTLLTQVIGEIKAEQPSGYQLEQTLNDLGFCSAAERAATHGVGRVITPLLKYTSTTDEDENDPSAERLRQRIGLLLLRRTGLQGAEATPAIQKLLAVSPRLAPDCWKTLMAVVEDDTILAEIARRAPLTLLTMEVSYAGILRGSRFGGPSKHPNAELKAMLQAQRFAPIIAAAEVVFARLTSDGLFWSAGQSLRDSAGAEEPLPENLDEQLVTKSKNYIRFVRRFKPKIWKLTSGDEMSREIEDLGDRECVQLALRLAAVLTRQLDPYVEAGSAVIAVLAPAGKKADVKLTSLLVDALVVPVPKMQQQALTAMIDAFGKEKTILTFFDRFAQRDSYDMKQIETFVAIIAELDRDAQGGTIARGLMLSAADAGPSEVPWIIKLIAIDALGKVGGPETVDLLKRFLSDDTAFIITTRSDGLESEQRVVFADKASGAIELIEDRHR